MKMNLKADKNTQVTPLVVYSLKREKSALYNYYLTVSSNAEDQFSKTKMRSEEYIINRIGEMGNELNSIKKDNLFIRSLLYNPFIIKVKNDELIFYFKHDLTYFELILKESMEVKKEFFKCLKETINNRKT